LNKIVSIIGLGYVGLPLAVAIAKSGITVVGVDTDIAKVSLINQGTSPIADVSNSELLLALKNQNMLVTADFSTIQSSEIVIICVPTPLTNDHRPDLSYLDNAIKSIAQHISSGTLLIIESTVAPMSTRNYIIPLLQRYASVKISDLDIAYSPERIDPLNQRWNVVTTPKLVGGLNQKSTERAINFYRNFVDTVVECESLEVAESAKVLENSFRLINISFINEFSIFCNRIGIDVNAVISAAATKPYGFMSFSPGIGAGGHCIPVDPIYLATAARSVGAPTSFIDLADKVNQDIPQGIVRLAEVKLGVLKGSRILVIGVAYKPNLSDVRESPAIKLISILQHHGAHVSWHDDLVKEWIGSKSVPLDNNFDLAILATPHDYLNLNKLGSVPVLNTRSSI
jgi:UDP-N-acetyl-D-glucosamine dehydrogenase